MSNNIANRFARQRDGSADRAETIALGFTHLVFYAPGPDQRRFLDLYARDVLPRLRARYA